MSLYITDILYSFIHWNNGIIHSLLACLSESERHNSNTFNNFFEITTIGLFCTWKNKLKCLPLPVFMVYIQLLKCGSKLPNPQQLVSETSISYCSVSSIKAHWSMEGMPWMNQVPRVPGDLFQFLIKLVPRLNSISLYFSYMLAGKGLFIFFQKQLL